MTKKRILIVEDEAELRFSLSMALEWKGYEVYVAENGFDALQKILTMDQAQTPIHLLISDIFMPELSGDALIKTLRDLKMDIPVLAISGDGNKDLVVRLMRAGCQDFIDKPIETEELESHVEKILHSHDSKITQQELVNVHRKKKRYLLHDLNNMVGTALGYADLALRDLEEEHPARRRVSKLVASATIAGNISTELMSVGITGKEPMKTLSDIRKAVQEMTSLLSEIAPDGVKVVAHLPEESVPFLADTEQLKQAMFNLGLNALQAMPQGGILSFALTIEAVVRANVNLPVQCLCIHVEDTGRGMASEILEKIKTEPCTTKPDGHGIGLTAVKGIVKEHGGWIDVKSEPGKGSEFKLFFPNSAADPSSTNSGR